MFLALQITVLLPFVVRGFLVTHDAPRNVTKILTVGNGGSWGSWHPPQYCATGSYAVGFNMKIEGNQHGGDDTALNAILLKCEMLESGTYAGYVESGEGQWGTWVGESSCERKDGHQMFLTAFSLQVEPNQHGLDDTTANWVKFKCRDFGQEVDYDLNHAPGHGLWGSYAGWSEFCPLKSAICGIQSRIENAQGGGDDTALNDVKFFCCSQEVTESSSVIGRNAPDN